MVTVDIRGLSKAYGDLQVLRDLNVQVGEREFLTLLGPSGCGKTTTLRCVAGLERPDAGTITIGGRVVASAAGRRVVPPNRRDIGMVFQSYALWPHMTVFANVAYPLKMRRTAGAGTRRRVTEILEMVGMAPYAQRQVTELSGGQQQRVALARAMVARPGLLLFDEPLSNLDAKLRHTMRREIRAAHDAAGGSSIYVTHDQQEAITLSDRIVVLRGGVIQQMGSPREIYHQPANEFVADFVGFDNLLDGTVAQRDGARCAISLGGASGLVWAANGAAPAVGVNVRLAVRAEHLGVERLATVADTPAGSVAGVVRSRTYTGQHVEYVIDAGQQNLLVRVDEEAEARVGVGECAVVRFDPAKTVLIHQEAGEPPAPQSPPAPPVSLEEVGLPAARPAHPQPRHPLQHAHAHQTDTPMSPRRRNTMRPLPSRRLGITLGLTAVLACACSTTSTSTSGPAGSSSAASSTADLGSAHDTQALEALYAKAVAAGQTSVVIYGPSAGTDQQEYTAFKQAFPKITISGVPVVGPPMDTKIAAEASSGKHIADIAYTGGSGMMNYLSAGYFTPYAPVNLPGASGLAPGSVGPDDSFYGLTVSIAGTVSNSNTVKTPPGQWTDLEGPAYKNEIAMYDPTALGLMSDNFAHLALNAKYSQLEAGLKANAAQLFPSSSLTGPLTAVAQGAKKVAIGAPYNFYLSAKASGAPVTFSLFSADNYWTTLYAGVLKGAPHQLAAELYESWMLTPAGQRAIASEGLYSTVTGSAHPSGLPALSAVPLQPVIPLSQLAAADNAAVTRAKQFWGS